LKIPVTLEFTAIVSGHGKTKSYLHRFKLIDNPMYPCKVGAQSSEHLIYDCEILEIQRKTMKHQIKPDEEPDPPTTETGRTIFTRIYKIY
jgi:hypothetical protein